MECLIRSEIRSWIFSPSAFSHHRWIRCMLQQWRVILFVFRNRRAVSCRGGQWFAEKQHGILKYPSMRVPLRESLYANLSMRISLCESLYANLSTRVPLCEPLCANLSMQVSLCEWKRLNLIWCTFISFVVGDTFAGSGQFCGDSNKVYAVPFWRGTFFSIVAAFCHTHSGHLLCRGSLVSSVVGY